MGTDGVRLQGGFLAGAANGRGAWRVFGGFKVGGCDVLWWLEVWVVCGFWRVRSWMERLRWVWDVWDGVAGIVPAGYGAMLGGIM